MKTEDHRRRRPRHPGLRGAVRAPSKLLMLLELRAAWELGALLASWPWLRRAPAGDGHPVLVLPGLASDDLSTLPLRRFLRQRGHAVHGWGLGLNRGRVEVLESELIPKLEALHRSTGQRVSLVGWSMGGLYARELACRRPELVRQLVMIGSPFGGPVRANNVWRLYERLSGRSIDAPHHEGLLAGVPDVPTTSIWSRTDGIVAWQGCVEPPRTGSENIEVVASHLGLANHPATAWAVADRLAQPEGRWRPFSRNAASTRFYPRSEFAA